MTNSEVESAGTYYFFQNIDLVKQHPLLVLVHGALPQDFNGSLGARLPVDAHAHFTECT
jgi:hypothetical protein